MVARITALEAKTRFGQLLDRVSQGEVVVVTRHDKPVARIIPVDRPAQEEVRAAVAGLRERRPALIVAFVMDASMAFTWVLPSQASSEAEALLESVEAGAGAAVRPLWCLEVVNGPLAAERRQAPERLSALDLYSRSLPIGLM